MNGGPGLWGLVAGGYQRVRLSPRKSQGSNVRTQALSAILTKILRCMPAFLGPASPPADGPHGAEQGDWQQMLGGDRGFCRLLPEVRTVGRSPPLALVGPYFDVCGRSRALAICFHRKISSLSLLPQAVMSM